MEGGRGLGQRSGFGSQSATPTSGLNVAKPTRCQSQASALTTALLTRPFQERIQCYQSEPHEGDGKELPGKYWGWMRLPHPIVHKGGLASGSRPGKCDIALNRGGGSGGVEGEAFTGFARVRTRRNFS